MYKNIFHTFVPRPEVIGVRSKDIDGQKILIDRGFSGFEIQRLDDGWEIIYGMPVNKIF
jgi:hypothetical protein